MIKTKKKYLLFSRRERWGLSIWGWVLLILLILVPGILFLWNAYSILAPVHREKTDVLVLEWFVSDYLMEDAIKEFKTGHYTLLITTGTPLELGSLLVAYGNTAALALKEWLGKNRPQTRAINLMTMSVHGARSQLLFQAAMGKSVKVGIISLKNFYYGPHNWWKNSKGFREVMNEIFGYFYVRLFFRPYEISQTVK